MDAGLDDLLADADFACGDSQESKHQQHAPGRRRGATDPAEKAARSGRDKPRGQRRGEDGRGGAARADDDGDVDALLRELRFDDSDDDDVEPPHARRMQMPVATFSTRASSSMAEDSSGSGSSVAVLGGESARTDRQGSLARKIASANLHCVNCDMTVNRWTGRAWADEADYMFFRNTAPDREKMRAMLVSRKNHAAYACQCSWVAVQEMAQVRIGQRVDGKSLKWVQSS